MIEIIIHLDKEIVTSFLIRGHACYDVKGKDLVCAGVSAIVFGAINNLKNVAKYVKVDKDQISFETSKEIPYHDQIVLETLMISLKMMNENYPRNVSMKVIRKE